MAVAEGNKRFSVTVREELLQLIDAEAARQGMSRSELVAAVLERWYSVHNDYVGPNGRNSETKKSEVS